ncbi:hypothetical protein Tco_0527894 [Tanacetum coccineum]
MVRPQDRYPQKQLATDALELLTILYCPNQNTKNFPTAATEACWFSIHEDENHEFDRLDVRELVTTTRYSVNVILPLKWIYKVKHDEYVDVLKNKATPCYQKDFVKRKRTNWMMDLSRDPRRPERTKYRPHDGVPEVSQQPVEPDLDFFLHVCYISIYAHEKATLRQLKRVFRYLQGSINMDFGIAKDTRHGTNSIRISRSIRSVMKLETLKSLPDDHDV